MFSTTFTTNELVFPVSYRDLYAYNRLTVSISRGTTEVEAEVYLNNIGLTIYEPEEPTRCEAKFAVQLSPSG